MVCHNKTNIMKADKLQEKIDKLHNALSNEVGSSTMDMIDELVELNLLLEQECNK